MKTVKRILILLLLTVTVNVVGQDSKRQERSKKIEAMKIAYITEQLELTPAEAKKFWPLYNQHDEKMDLIRKKQRENIREKLKATGGVENMSEELAEQIIKFNMQSDKEYYEAKTNFVGKLQKVISYHKILKLQMAERDFRRKLFERLKKNREKRK